ncbi:MAG: hypothetical protein AAB693_02405 [Patescibacteria group bacterium]
MKKIVLLFLFGVVFLGCNSSPGSSPGSVGQEVISLPGQDGVVYIPPVPGEEQVTIKISLPPDSSGREKPRASNVIASNTASIVVDFYITTGDSIGRGKTLMDPSFSGAFRTITIPVVDGSATGTVSLPEGQYDVNVLGKDSSGQPIMVGSSRTEVTAGGSNQHNLTLSPAYGWLYKAAVKLTGFPGVYNGDSYVINSKVVGSYKTNSFQCVKVVKAVGEPDGTDFLCPAFQFELSKDPKNYILGVLDDNGDTQSAPFLIGVENFVGIELPVLVYPEQQSVSINVGLAFDIDYIEGYLLTNQDGSSSFIVQYEWDFYKDLPLGMHVGDSLILTLKLYDKTTTTSSCIIINEEVPSGIFVCKANFGNKEPNGPWWWEGAYVNYKVVPPTPQPAPTP